MHPAMFLRGSQARFTDPASGEVVQPGSLPHQLGDFVMAAVRAGFGLEGIGEYAPDASFAARYPRAEKYIGWPMVVVLRMHVEKKPEVRTDDGVTSLEGPLELYNGQLTLRIPLVAGGDKLVGCAGRIGQVDGEYLNVVIKPWLAEKLRVAAGNLVIVDNRNGKFTITRSAKNDSTESNR
jgi:hypothetical protein